MIISFSIYQNKISHNLIERMLEQKSKCSAILQRDTLALLHIEMRMDEKENLWMEVKKSWKWFVLLLCVMAVCWLYRHSLLLRFVEHFSSALSSMN